MNTEQPLRLPPSLPPSKNLVDRTGEPLQIGQNVRVQEVAGRYGQTRTVEGTILGLYHGHVVMRLSQTMEPFAHSFRSGQTQRRQAGDVITANIPVNGYSKFDDFEHGHETWAEIVSTPVLTAEMVQDLEEAEEEAPRKRMSMRP